MNGFSDDQIVEIRKGQITFDAKYAALASFVKETASNKGRPSAAAYDALFEAGYTKANFIDILIVIGDKIISNYLHNITEIPVDWPAIPQI
jgi:alkylhydroperoxidase family enzyme